MTYQELQQLAREWRQAVDEMMSSDITIRPDGTVVVERQVTTNWIRKEMAYRAAIDEFYQ